MVYRIPVPERMTSLSGLDRVDYADAYAARTPIVRTPEQWARAIEESHGLLMRTVVRPIHRHVLGFQLAPSGLPGHVIGFEILHSEASEGVLGTCGRILTPRIVALTSPGQLVLSTLVKYEHPSARIIWSLVGPIHRMVERYLLDSATRRATVTPSPAKVNDSAPR